MPVRATWSHFSPESGSDCTASAEATFGVESAKPPRYIALPRRSRLMNSMEWRVLFGKGVDRRPVELRVRGVRRGRLPRKSAPFKTMTSALRMGDRGLAFTGPPHRILRSAGWAFYGAFVDDDDIRITMRGLPRGRGCGFELQLVQAGDVLGRTRAIGRCNSLTCSFRPPRR